MQQTIPRQRYKRRAAGRNGYQPWQRTKTLSGGSSYGIRPWILLPAFVIILGMVIAVGLTQRSVSGTSTVTATTHSAICGVAGAPACTQPSVYWANMASAAPAAVIDAATTTPMYQSAVVTNDLIGYALQHGTLGTPVLVKPYRDDVGMPQKWIIPVVQKNALPLALLTFVFDPVHLRLRASEFDAVSQNMFYTTHVFPFVSAAQAVAVVAQQQHIQVQTKGSGQPTLIYYPSDHEALLTQQNAVLNIGGTAAIDPIWRVTGSDGHYYYVDHLGMQSYRSSAFAVDSAYAKMPATLAEQQ